MTRMSGRLAASQSTTRPAGPATRRTAWFDRTSIRGVELKAAATALPSDSQSWFGSGANRVSLHSESGTGSWKTARPALSGPRSAMPASIVANRAPSPSRSAGFLRNNPTMPHIGASRIGKPKPSPRPGAAQTDVWWRICFRWTDDGPCKVEIVDYH